MRPLRRIWAEPTDLTHPEQSAHHGLGPVGGHPSQAARLFLCGHRYEGNPVDSVVTCRNLTWGSCPSSSQGPLRFFDDFDYRASLVDSRGSCVHVQVNLSALFPVVPLLCCPLCIRRLRFNVLYHFRAHRVVFWWRTGHLQESLCVRFSLRQARWQVHPVSPHRARTRKMHAERGNYQWPPCPACLCVVCSCTCTGSVVDQSSLVTPSPHARLRWVVHR